ncbi:hypothetical protein QAD02_004659 [Eretmocerus hayati]|uniref:Uncharacterized protein n=1 Tax=Eretmocerus hayati TaxID=131215 RepID=A0ACC2NQL9_9HYME|nr:hypothetical protein QAD02_004659 [Eretmocerus hayati]
MAYQRIGSSSSTSSRNCNKPPPLDTTHHYLSSNDHQQPEHSPHKQSSPGLVYSPDNNGTHKYSIVDLDKLGHSDVVTTTNDPYISVQPPHKRQLLLLQESRAPSPHEILPDVVTHHQLALHHVEPEHQQQQWASPGGPTTLWSDCGLQRVPDVVQQDLSPYITTPTTPAETPDADSSEHHTPETPSSTVFNFDWPGEQHVPNLRLLSFRDDNLLRCHYWDPDMCLELGATFR